MGTRKKEIRREQINETVKQLDIPKAVFRDLRSLHPVPKVLLNFVLTPVTAFKKL